MESEMLRVGECMVACEKRKKKGNTTDSPI